MQLLSTLEGIWKGRGSGSYPTIEAFDYEETLRFERDPGEPLLHYEQRTRLIPSGESSHWESGFLRPLPEDFVEISNSQNSGRVEVLRGRWVAERRESLRIIFESVVLDNDPRLIRTRRIWTLRGDTLHYEMLMATRTTPEPVLQTHLRGILQRAPRKD